jgi:hypothetical protein
VSTEGCDTRLSVPTSWLAFQRSSGYWVRNWRAWREVTCRSLCGLDLSGFGIRPHRTLGRSAHAFQPATEQIAALCADWEQ